jgi:hypothetical protein
MTPDFDPLGLAPDTCAVSVDYVIPTDEVFSLDISLPFRGSISGVHIGDSLDEIVRGQRHLDVLFRKYEIRVGIDRFSSPWTVHLILFVMRRAGLAIHTVHAVRPILSAYPINV